MKLIEALRAYTKIVQAKLDATILHSHNPTKREGREEVIREGFLRQFLPHCYGVGSGLVFSADGDGSQQVDIVIYDAVYSINDIGNTWAGFNYHAYHMVTHLTP